MKEFGEEKKEEAQTRSWEDQSTIIAPNPTQPENTKIPCKIGTLRVTTEDAFADEVEFPLAPVAFAEEFVETLALAELVEALAAVVETPVETA
jgi:hypothetical protein